jgi:hypothetical protein
VIINNIICCEKMQYSERIQIWKKLIMKRKTNFGVVIINNCDELFGGNNLKVQKIRFSFTLRIWIKKYLKYKTKLLVFIIFKFWVNFPFLSCISWIVTKPSFTQIISIHTSLKWNFSPFSCHNKRAVIIRCKDPKN